MYPCYLWRGSALPLNMIKSVSQGMKQILLGVFNRVLQYWHWCSITSLHSTRHWKCLQIWHVSIKPSETGAVHEDCCVHKHPSLNAFYKENCPHACSLIIVYWLLRYIDVTIGEVQWAACCADADVPGKEPGYVWLLHFLGMLRCSGLLGAGQPSVAGQEVSLEVVTNQDTLRLHTNHNPTSTLAPSIFL